MNAYLKTQIRQQSAFNKLQSPILKQAHTRQQIQFTFQSQVIQKGLQIQQKYQERVEQTGNLQKARAASGEDHNAQRPLGNATLPVYIFLWYASNCWFNIVNKQTLNAFSMPWFISTFQLFVSVVMVAIFWALGWEKKPKFSKELFISLIPAGFFHCVGHVSACVSFSLVAVSFSHIVKSAEPVYSVFLGQLLFGISYPIYTWLTLIPIIAGTSLSALKEISFTWPGFTYANISNLGMVFRNIYSKKNLGEYKDLHGISLYGLMSFVSLLFCLPVALVVEGPQWKGAYQAVASNIGHTELIKLIALAGLLYHAYNQASYMVLDTGISALGLSVGNVMKRIAVILSSVIFFRNPVSPLNWAGSAMAIFGTYLYSLAQQRNAKEQKEKKAYEKLQETKSP